MSSELMQKKMEIAKRAGELEKEISGLGHLALKIEEKKTAIHCDGKTLPESITIQISETGSSSAVLRSYELDPDGTEFHDAILIFLKSMIDRRAKELDDLIKVLQ